MPEGRVMVVTGASSGIGRALAIAAAHAGWRVLLVARRRERLTALQEEIAAAGGSAEMLVADVCAADTPHRIVENAMRSFGRVDVVVNNAGNGANGRLLDQSDEALEAQWQTHVAAPLRISRAALPALRASRGGLVFVGSGLARVPAPYYGAYCTAKTAIRGAATQLRRELRPEGIAVTYVDPGAVDTEFSQSAGKQRERDAIAVKPERVARAMLRGIEQRARVVNAVPAHALVAMLGEFFPRIADAAIVRFVSVPAPEPPKPAFAPTTPLVAAPQPVLGSSNEFDAALAPLARRMERVKLTPAFVRGLLNAGTSIDFGDAAMRWAGMPNKNERAALHEVFEALAAAGYLESAGDETWVVRRAAD
ncbi:MAG TPA: SDR family NAD(P)-dependent oxidoreductase [Candidatus Dormibacteraeota bacterium]|nr:SDR family NAD(P)-dependent oxidoreductase [Candidatus Dormibacteraeota bacterium]